MLTLILVFYFIQYIKTAFQYIINIKIEVVYILVCTTSSKSSLYFIPLACLNSPSTFQGFNSQRELVVTKLDSICLDKLNDNKPLLCFPASPICLLWCLLQIVLMLHPQTTTHLTCVKSL